MQSRKSDGLGPVLTNGWYFFNRHAWAHIDISGTADTSRESPLSIKNATGFGIRLLLDFLSL